MTYLLDTNVWARYLNGRSPEPVGWVRRVFFKNLSFNLLFAVTQQNKTIYIFSL